MNYQYNIGCSLSNLKGVRDFIRQSLKGQGMSDVEISAVVLAMDEMCSNLMIHAHHCNPDHTLELHVNTGTSQVVFEIIDDGSMFDINQFSTPDLGNLVHEKRKGGLGIRLVKSIMDGVEYFNRDGKNVCRLTKNVQ
jgi:serine/threonine-protein kinase RsbW